jgi:DNA polymerase/3'-5' exonuclease PolX
MRTEALKKGFTINEYGIYKTRKVGGKTVKGALIPTKTEEDIFKLIDMPFLKPEERL